ALAFAREVERRLPKKVTTAWWKEERGRKVFIDFNQNARDRTVASAYSVRARKDAAVSAPVTWDELPDVETEDFTMTTMPARFAADALTGAARDCLNVAKPVACVLSDLFPTFTVAPPTGSPASTTRNVMTRPLPVFLEAAVSPSRGRTCWCQRP